MLLCDGTPADTVRRLERLFPAVRAMNPIVPRAWLLAALLLLGLQYWICRKYGEPYPALMMPGFDNVPGRRFALRYEALYYRGEELLDRQLAETLFPAFPRSMATVLPVRVLRSLEVAPEVRNWLARHGRE